MTASRAVRVRSGVTLTLGFSVLLLSGLAQACPMCASQQPGGSARVVALGLMLVLPFAIAAAVFAALRRSGWEGERSRALREPSP